MASSFGHRWCWFSKPVLFFKWVVDADPKIAVVAVFCRIAPAQSVVLVVSDPVCSFLFRHCLQGLT
ncbi:hypothetical protein A2U01_0039821, partial [Trifolium medium]|nr:hypothetical protein [Trifolium medium]